MTWIPDATAIRAFRESPELFRLRYRKHLVPARPEEAPNAGRAMHAALKVWFDQPTSDLDAAMAALRDAWGEEPLFHEGLKRPLSLFERLLEAYAEKWPRERDPFTVVANEEYLEGGIDFHGGRGFRYCGVRDRIIAFEDGSRYVKDSKTTSAYLKPEYFEPFRVGEQMNGYLGLELVNGRECQGYYIDGIHVDTRSQSVKPERDFLRHGPVRVPRWQLDRWARDMEWTLKQIETLDREVGPDEPWPVYANFPYGKVGPYWDFLVEPPELHEALASGFSVEPWNPKELVEAT